MESIVVGMFDETDEALAFVNDLEGRGVPRGAIDIEGGRSDQRPKEERGFFQRMGDILSGQDRGALTEGVRRGGTLVSARVDDPLVDETVYLMKAHGAVNIDERAAGWSNPGSAAPNAVQPALQGEQHIPVIEEELKVGKRVVEKGGVRVYTHVQQRPVEEQVELRQERVVVERRPVNRAASQDDAQLFQEGTVEFQERSEELVVGKEARVVEEVVIGKAVEQHVETVRDTVRRTDVQVEEIGDPDRYGADFQEHWSRQYHSTGQPYEQYAPAYHFGRQLASTEAYRGRDWQDVRSDARTSWESKNPGTWDRFEEAIRYAWARMTGSANRSAMRDLP